LPWVISRSDLVEEYDKEALPSVSTEMEAGAGGVGSCSAVGGRLMGMRV
jgi:hypothetical protein